MAGCSRTAVVVRHFADTCRLSGLESFSRTYAKALAHDREVSVFSGGGGSVQKCGRVVHHSIGGFFWTNVWRSIDPSTHNRVIVLSGIHSPRWARTLAWCLDRCSIPSSKRLFVQAVSLDRPWSRKQGMALRRAARVATLNPLAGGQLRAAVPDIVVGTPGIDLARIRSVASEVNGHAGRKRIGFFGHFNRVKGADRLPAILRAIGSSGWECIVAGTGAFDASLQQWASEQDHVQIHGYLSDPIPLLASCDILIAPFRQSATILGLSQVVIEAMACGVPVVGSRTEAVAGVVSHNVEGFLADSDADFAEALDRLLTDEDCRLRMAAAARVRAECFSIRRVVSTLDAAFDVSPGRMIHD